MKLETQNGAYPKSQYGQQEMISYNAINTKDQEMVYQWDEPQ